MGGRWMEEREVRLMERWMGLIKKLVDWWKDGWIGGRMDGLVEGWVDWWKNGWKDE